MTRGSTALVTALFVFVTGCTATRAGPDDDDGRRDQPRSQHTSSAVTTPTQSASTPERPPKPTSLSVVMSGDVLLHDGLWATAQHDAETTGRGVRDFRPIMASMRPTIRPANLAICHMETPLAPRGGPFSGYPIFSVPAAVVPALRWAGYDACTTASNHSLDQGFDGLVRTLGYFTAAGIQTSGTAATRRAAREPVIVDVDGVSVGLVSATYGTNGIPLPDGRHWSVNLIDVDRIIALAERARANGADIVLVALHWGVEYTHEPSAEQRSVAAALTKSDAIDFVYGHHAHVVQPYDRVHGTWVVYGLGNAIAQQSTDVSGVYDGNTCRVTFRERKDGSFGVAKLETIPTMITKLDGKHPMRWLNVDDALHDPRLARLRDDLRATRHRVLNAVNMLGAFEHGVVEGG